MLCETAGIAPDIRIDVNGTTISIEDNGCGISPETVSLILDYKYRTSDKAFIRSPSRGQQGNALKTIIAIPFVLSEGKISHLEIESRNIRHKIELKVDAILGKPVFDHKIESIVKNSGIKITVYTTIILDDLKAEFFTNRA